MDINSKTFRRFSSTTNCEFVKGLWSVTTDMTDAVSDDGKTWDEIKIESMGVDKDPDLAYRMALGEVLKEFQRRVTNRGLRSLFEARELDANAQTKIDGN